MDPAQALFSPLSQISGGQAFLQGEFAEVGVRANGAFGSTNVPTGFHQNVTNCLGFRVDRAYDGWGNSATTDDGDFFCPGSPFEGWQFKVGANFAKNDNSVTNISGAVSDLQTTGSAQCVSWNSASPYNGITVSQRYCVPIDGQALHTDVTLENTSGASINDIYFGRGFDPDDFTGTGTVPLCNGVPASTNTYQSCNAVTGQGTEAQATARWGNGAFIALQSFDARARVARQTGGFSSPDPSTIWAAGNTSATSGTYRGDIGEFPADAGLYVALNVPTLGAGATTSFRISYVLSSEGNKAPVLGAPIPSGISQTVAHVSSTINPKGFSTTANLVYSTSSSFADSTTVSIGTFTGSDELTFDVDMSGLSPSTSYYAKVIAENEKGTTESAVFDFTTLDASAPTVTSEDPTITVDDGPVTLSGTLNPNGYAATASFQYSTTPDFSGAITTIPVTGTFTGTSAQSVSTSVSGLNLTTTYYFRLKVTNASGSAYGSTISFVNADLVAPVALVVTSLADDGSNGTLRWAITQANATAGGIYDAIIFGLDGTITLTSALPQITQAVTITGNGITNTIIDGNSLYRPFNIASGKALTISNLMLKRGQNANGGLIYNGSGTVNATNVRFTSMTGGSAVFNNNNNSLATYTDCQFDNLNYGIAGDYGSTPYLATGVTSWSGTADTVFTNRTYVLRGQFSNNSYGIMNYRFTKVENSTFSNNTWAASITGINRTQITGSTFNGNGVAIYHNSWVPVGWNVGTDFRFINNNTFTNNGTAIYLDDGYNNNHKNPGWSTITNNSFDESGTWVTYYLWNGTSNVGGTVGFNQETTLFTQSANVSVATTTTTTTTTTTSTTTTSTTIPGSTTTSSTTTTSTTVAYVPPVIEVPTGTTTPEIPEATIPETPLPETPLPTEVDATIPPEATVTIPDSLPDSTVPTDEPVVIPDMPDAGKPISTKDLTDILDTTFTPDASTEEITAVLDGLLDTKLTSKQFDAVVDATLGSLDEPGADVGAVLDSFLGADLSDKEFAKVLDAVFLADVSDAVFVEALTTMLSADISDAEFAKVLDSAFSADASPEAMVSALGAILDGPASAGDIAKIMDAVFDEDISVADAGAVLGDLLSGDLSGASLEAVFDSVFDGDLSASDTVALAETILAEPLSAEEFSTVVNAIFDEKVSDEILVGTFEAILSTELSVEKFAEVVNVLENANITNDQVSQVVDLIVSQDGGISGEQATELATSPKVLESIDGEQATAVFDAIVVAEVSQEAGAQIAEALASAATDVKESFEEQINVFAGVFDTYVALGSQINVGDRRTVIAVAAVVAVAGASSAMGGGSGSSPSSGGSGAPTRGSDAYRKDEEEEASGEIAGDGVEWIKQLSIFRYNNGVKILDWGLFMKKFIYGVMNLGFTISGCLVVYLTLSGSLQRIAGVSSVVALLCALYLHMQEPDNN